MALNEAQKEINRINASIQYYEKIFGVDSDVTSAYVESLYTGETKKYFHKTKQGGVRISKSKESAEVFKPYLPGMREKKTAGEQIREARKEYGMSKDEAVSFVEDYNEANRNIEDLLAELYAMSENGELPEEVLNLLEKGRRVSNRTEVASVQREPGLRSARVRVHVRGEGTYTADSSPSCLRWSNVAGDTMTEYINENTCAALNVQQGKDNLIILVSSIAVRQVSILVSVLLTSR